MISILPVVHITKPIMEEVFNKALKGLKDVGFTVVSATTEW